MGNVVRRICDIGFAMLTLRAFRNKYYVQRANIIGQLWSASAKRTLREAEKIFEE